MLVVIVVDRAVAIIRPNYYRQLTVGQASRLCQLTMLITISLKIVPSWIGVDFTRVVPCINTFSPTTPLFNAYSMNVDVALWFLVLLLYIGLMGYIKFRVMPAMERQRGPQGQDSAAMITFRRQEQLLLLLRRLVLVHFGFMIFSRTLLGVASLLPPSQISLRLASYGGLVASFDCAGNVAVLLATHKDLREASVPCFFKGGSTSTVHPISQQRSPGRVRNMNRRV